MHSRKTLYSVLLAATCFLAPALAGYAYATPGNNGNGQGGCGEGQQTNGCAGTSGPTGPQGPTGPMGPQGERGATGATGAKGEQGEAGKDGVAVNGKDGAEGKPGATGAAGRDAPQDAVTAPQLQNAVGQMNSRMDSLQNQIDRNDRRASAGISGVAAMASIPQAVERGSVVVGMGVGAYDSEGGVAIGASACDADCGTIGKVAVTVTSRGTAAIGAGVVWRFK